MRKLGCLHREKVRPSEGDKSVLRSPGSGMYTAKERGIVVIGWNPIIPVSGEGLDLKERSNKMPGGHLLDTKEGIDGDISNTSPL